ncbi:hypothetical protein RISK_003480 [Rhodopirellula islandica]|uniref:Uncharacterized protein n=1 Tax=Rhodopirellula islandica TaxID=595434 RepID=A0A0J1BD71_RHOIS|nr:hypothetical protein RISK_003480 [Rhodopirellula islandica]
MIPSHKAGGITQAGWAWGTKPLPPASNQKDLGKFFWQC